MDNIAGSPVEGKNFYGPRPAALRNYIRILKLIEMHRHLTGEPYYELLRIISSEFHNFFLLKLTFFKTSQIPTSLKQSELVLQKTLYHIDFQRNLILWTSL